MDRKVIAIDIGGTKISLAVVSGGKFVSEVTKFSTPKTAQAIFDNILDNIDKILKNYKEGEIAAVAFATAGAVNIDNTRVTGSTGNLPEGYTDLDFAEAIKNRFSLGVFVENDANAAAYAEYKIGAAKGHENTITVTLGTGVGGGIVVNGRLLRGKSGAAGEVGHLRMREEKRFYCTCGHYDCWEAYASGTGYARIAREELVNYPQDKKTYLHLKLAEEITSYDVLEGVRQNDELSKKIHERWETMVVKGLISLANVFDPDSIVLSGGMADFVNFEKVQRIMDESLVVPNVEILRAQAGNYAGMLGAALLAEERFL